jgi:predicted DNA-binding transcriptional regulator YafY
MPTEDGTVRATRLLDLERLLLSYPGRQWRTREIAEWIGVSVDTATRDLEDLSGKGRLMLVREGSTAAVTWYVSHDARTKLPPLRLDYAQGVSALRGGAAAEPAAG